jgi:hypothetical protein
VKDVRRINYYKNKEKNKNSSVLTMPSSMCKTSILLGKRQVEARKRRRRNDNVQH